MAVVAAAVCIVYVYITTICIWNIMDDAQLQQQIKERLRTHLCFTLRILLSIIYTAIIKLNIFKVVAVLTVR